MLMLTCEPGHRVMFRVTIRVYSLHTFLVFFKQGRQSQGAAGVVAPPLFSKCNVETTML